MNIRRRREELGISRNELSKKVRVSETAIYKWESGEAKPRADMLPKLAHVLGCTIDELFREPQKEAPGPGAEGR